MKFQMNEIMQIFFRWDVFIDHVFDAIIPYLS